MAFSKASDLDLITDLRAGRHDALTEIFRRHWRPLYEIACHKLRSHELAEEIVQELFAELWDKRKKLFAGPPEALNLSSYLSRAVKNKILNHIRRQLYNQRYWEYCRRHLPSFENSAHELAEFNELQDKLNSAIGQLSDKTREIFVLHKLKGVPVGQISRELKLSEKAIGYHLTKSVKELRSQLRDYF